MSNDPFYQDIHDALDRRLDPLVFEECVVDLLRTEWPTLVPVTGGTDSGMDGAVADGVAEPYPIVITTGAKALANLTKNLNSYMEHGGARRGVMFATSRALTPKQRSKLEERARELGFALHQTYDRHAIAQRLYSSPRWCRELLGLTGEAPALSAFPPGNRPQHDVPLVGREADLEWLIGTTGDLVLSGEPGIGKTFLLSQLARRGDALFVAEGDKSRIAAEIRRSAPRRIVADDAHANPDLVTQLRHLREVLGADFDIIAVTWPGDEAVVREALGVAPSKSRRLEPLVRSDIAAIVSSVGLAGPPGLVGTIVDQAEGRPGLAATLAHLCLAGSAREVALGDALTQSLVAVFKKLVGDDPFGILVAFAAGGASGMRMDRVADVLQLGRLALYKMVVRLAAGGVLTPAASRDRSEEVRYVVRPQALREVLIRDGIFSAMPLVPYPKLLPHIDDWRAATLALIGARHRGATVPGDLLLSAVESAPSREVLRSFAYLGPREAKAAILAHQDRLHELAGAGLRHIPAVTIPLLLTAAVGDARALHSTPEHPLRQLQDWIKDARPASGEAPRRRLALVTAAGRWTDEGGDRDIALRAACLAMCPGFEFQTLDPIKDTTITITWGLLPSDELVRVQELWPQILDMVERTSAPDWNTVIDALEEWAPLRGAHYEPPPPDAAEAARPGTQAALLRLSRLVRAHPGAARCVAAMARSAGYHLRCPRDKVFDALFPPERRGVRDPNDVSFLSPALDLAANWASEQPFKVFGRIVEAVRESRWLGHRDDYALRVMWHEIANRTSTFSPWIETALSIDAPTSFPVDVFIASAAQSGEAGWHDLAARCLAHSELSGLTASVLLTLDEVPVALLASAIQRLRLTPKLVEVAALRGQIPVTTMRALLSSGHEGIATKAAIGEWLADPKGTVRSGVEDAWEAAVVNCGPDEYFLREILAERPDLAMKWLTQFAASSHGYSGIRNLELASAAVRGLDRAQRLSLLKKLPEDILRIESFAAELIADDPELYRCVLADRTLAHLHLSPLECMPDERWKQNAQLALAASHEPGSVAVAAFRGITGWSGDESALWQRWVDAFDSVAGTSEGPVLEAARIGVRIATERRDRALEGERREAVYGHFPQ